jgi:two-component system chemotaxis response regulator CheY
MRTCLVVDDSRVVRKVASRIVEALDFEPIEAGDGLEALSICRAAMPDAVLIDRGMPVMDGVEFTRLLRLEPGGGAPVVVFCTAETEPDRIAEALDAGADEYVMKPFDGDIIAAKFAEAGLL